MPVSCRCLGTMTPTALQGVQHFITLSKSNNQPAHFPHPLQQNKSNKVAYLDWGWKVVHRRASKESPQMWHRVWANNCKNLERESRSKTAVISVHVTKFPHGLNLSCCLQDHALLAFNKMGHRYIPCARQPIPDGAISNLGGGEALGVWWREKRGEKGKRKRTPNASLFVFRLALSNPPPPPPPPPCSCKVDQRISRPLEMTSWRIATQGNAHTPHDTPIVSANRKRAAVSLETDAP